VSVFFFEKRALKNWLHGFTMRLEPCKRRRACISGQRTCGEERAFVLIHKAKNHSLASTRSKKCNPWIFVGQLRQWRKWRDEGGVRRRDGIGPTTRGDPCKRCACCALIGRQRC